MLFGIGITVNKHQTMIEFNSKKDFNLAEIRNESKLFNLVTRYKYHVRGLRQKGNPSVFIEYYHDRVDEGFEETLAALVEFFKENGIEVQTYNKSDDGNRVGIFLRRDLREILDRRGKPTLAASVLSTIVYCLEGRIDLNQLQRYKLVSVPKFPKASEA